MSTRQRLVVIILALLLSSVAVAQQQTVLENADVIEKLKLFETWTQSRMEYYNLPGLTMGIVYDQQLVWQKGFGYADVEKKIAATPKTIFRIASISKLFTSTAIMQLRDAGKLRLDDPITKFLPWFKITYRFPDAPEITIEHILTHTSGLPREAAFPYWTDHNFPTKEQIKETLPDQETIFPSETKWKYSNLAMALLGQIVEAASGEDYETYIVNHIFKPLDMNSSSVYLTEAQMKNLATGYGIRLTDGAREKADFLDSKGITPAANLSSNVPDLAKFISLQFTESNDIGGKQILKANTLREMHRVHWLQPSWTSGWGLGFSVRKYGNRTLVGHAGWVGGYRSQLYFDTKDKIGVIVFSNGEDGSPTDFALQLFDTVVPAILKAAAPPAEVVAFDPAWIKYTGRYEDPSHWAEEVMMLNEKLVMYGFSYPPSEEADGGYVRLYPEGENTFRLSGDDGNGELVIFEMGKNGKVTRIKKGENYLYPVVSPSAAKFKRGED